ncbi:AcvB/VirJ family lysyl-phosphatidylglycerol hydrolase [Novosphingobium sp. Leaf2]|uniref:AcvB/VirJ family lysyl-phosphatidylglycerol hydrolase n=1 Tax=Novosphingobium sp. Leaf2 TaxID=1735670 RepID=UPI0006FD3F6F|nr:AcvB/VirJ family lysyl-phosphatidylglycerol hydrolase [Novosphingobium sp. Leaf2]KQM19452.1 type IV secretion system protein VirJ [Novosphingobium sp. Leaf2]
MIVRPRIRRRTVAGIVAAIIAVALIVMNAPVLGLLGTNEIRMFPASGPAGAKPPRYAAVLFSGDMGFTSGMSEFVAKAIAARGVPVVGVNTPVAFAHHRTQAQATAIVAQAIRTTLERTGAQQVLLLSHSYGSDIVATVAPHLPVDLRPRIAVIDLAVPALDVFFRADPSGFAYLWKPDAYPLPAIKQLKWAPVICIYGVEEEASLCPALKGTGAQVVGLPGGHHLDHDHLRLIDATVNALRAVVPGLRL